jgi:mRNA (2'-O-methyladenosine-N6-)-methyltransferase
MQSFQAKSQSLRDKMKKRREAIENLVASATAGVQLTESRTQSSPAHTDANADGQPPAKVACLSAAGPDKPVKESLNGTVAAAAREERRRSGGGDKGRGTAKKEVDELSALLSMQSAKEREERSQQEEILSLLSKPTAKELSLMDTFRSQDGGGVKEFCSYSTKGECMKVYRSREPCSKLHFVKILQPHTDESLGDCSFLNTCFHMDSCKYIHYEVDKIDIHRKMKKSSAAAASPANRVGGMLESTKLVPPQWIQCDMRNLKFEVLGKFSVIMADPPWDIHMELPYGTMSDDEMRQLPVPDLQVCLLGSWISGFI